ncbi:MAG: UvrB/UvrC motif-containing protein [Clostridia bacterium]|nr:UvrB/UvrC motif-containing protein [Clostridia bacterium]
MPFSGVNTIITYCAAKILEFEHAAFLRDEINKLKIN